MLNINTLATQNFYFVGLTQNFARGRLNSTAFS